MSGEQRGGQSRCREGRREEGGEGGVGGERRMEARAMTWTTPGKVVSFVLNCCCSGKKCIVLFGWPFKITFENTLVTCLTEVWSFDSLILE